MHTENVTIYSRENTEKPWVAKFSWVTGDANWLDHGGTWGRKIGLGAYHFVRIMANEEGPGYFVDLSEVNLLEAGEGEVNGALQSYGWEHERDLPEIQVAEACHSYGLKAVHSSEQTTNAHKSLREAKTLSYQITSSAEEHQKALNRPCNQVGSTAGELMRGDIYSALRRADNPAAQLMRKVYSQCTHTLGGQEIPADIREGAGS